tara:strand:- start:129 stop:758 length:630 start_codon:yes stop_codon:yes gene_type:complete
MRTPWSPTDFLSQVETHGGLAKNSRFTVSVVPPTSLKSGVQAEAISFLCKSAEIPAVAFNTTEDRVYGIEVLKPYGVTYEPITLSFFNVNKFSPRIFWEDWIEHIQPAKSRNMTYYDNMVGDIKIYHYSEDAYIPEPGFQNYYAHLREAWPVSIQESELSWAEDEPDAAGFDVQIQYKYWSRLSSNGLEPAVSAPRSSDGSRQGRERDF